MIKLKSDIHIVKKGRLYHVVESRNRLMRFKPWLGDGFSFLYDFIMNSSIFPKKFAGDIQKHYYTLTQELAGIHCRQILELGAGSGSAVNFLGIDNLYTGTDISPGLLKQAAKRFLEAGFPNPEFYVVSADDLPFESGVFDVCLCILSLNFIGSVEKVFQEVSRVLLPKGVFVCSVPVPERNRLHTTIRGVLYSEAELEKICQKYGFKFERISCENGVLLYFKAIKQS
ncbi:MAG: class I SAM-dependent methyltransferase [Spirochaetales bacterium]|nr:class I SAM-dependent methyltransferase [Spirochaetales bacterium]